jgi:uncharacterized paraquat-inducible protein A
VSTRVETLLASTVGWTGREFLDLALEALDQAGTGIAVQRQIRALLPDVCEACDETASDDGACLRCADELEQRRDDEINRQIDMARGK